MAAYGYGYSRLSEQGFIGFLPALSEGAWGSIMVPEGLSTWEPAAAPLALLPATVRWKLRLMWSLQALVAASGSDTGEAADADALWDSLQRQFDLRLLLSLESRDAAVLAAAKRLRSALLAGAGTEQTTWSRQKEVDFGRSQVVLAGQPPLDADVRLLGLGELLSEIARATEILANTIGHGADPDSAPVSRSTRIRRAYVTCSAAFNAVLEDIEWTIARQAPGEARDMWEALRKPLVALLDRYAERGPRESSQPAGEHSASAAVAPAQALLDASADEGGAAGESA